MLSSPTALKKERTRMRIENGYIIDFPELCSEKKLLFINPN